MYSISDIFGGTYPPLLVTDKFPKKLKQTTDGLAMKG
jgi:hypothetical protein